MLKNVRLLLFLKFEGLLSKSHCWQVSKMCVETFWNLEFKFSIKLLSNILLSFLHNVLTFAKTSRKLEFLNVFVFFQRKTCCGRLAIPATLTCWTARTTTRRRLVISWKKSTATENQPNLTCSSLFFVVFPNL
jgi:hypothetical protein